MRNCHYLVILLMTFVLLPVTAQAQEESMHISSLKAIHDITADFVIATAEMMDEDMYAYRPTVSVNSAGKLLAHVVNAQFGICSLAAGEESPAEGDYTEIATTRDEILTAVKASFAYCDKVYAEMTEERLNETSEFFGGDRRREMTIGAILSFNSTHTYEHYGNLVTYLRMNGMVPPSSQQ